MTILYQFQNLIVCVHGEGLLSHRPDLKQNHPITPNITVSRILLVEKSLRANKTRGQMLYIVNKVMYMFILYSED